MSMEIALAIIDTKYRKVVAVGEFNIQLLEKGLRIIKKYDCLSREFEDDSDIIIRENLLKVSIDAFHCKKDVMGSNLYWEQDDKNWVVCIGMTVVGREVDVQFKRSADAKAFHDKIINWLIS